MTSALFSYYVIVCKYPVLIIGAVSVCNGHMNTDSSSSYVSEPVLKCDLCKCTRINTDYIAYNLIHYMQCYTLNMNSVNP